jgi:pilus assembly protein CpaB
MLPAMVSDDPAAGGLAALIPPGKRAIAIPIAEDVAVSNMVRAGDLVDVLVVLRSGVLPHAGIGAASPGGVVARPLEGGAAASPADPGDESETRLLLQAVPVLTVGDHLGGLRGPQPGEGGTLTPPPQRQEPSRTMTLALSPEETERLALGRTLGSLELTLRNPHDTDQEVRPPITLQELRGAKTGPMAAAHARRPIELIVGNEHRTIYSLDAALPEAAPEPTRRTGARAPSGARPSSAWAPPGCVPRRRRCCWRWAPARPAPHRRKRRRRSRPMPVRRCRACRPGRWPAARPS